MDAGTEIVPIDFRRHAQEIAGYWQARLLRGAIAVHDGVARPRDMLGMCVMSVLAHNYDDAMPVLLALFGANGIGAPMLCTAAKVAKTGHVMADFVNKWGNLFKNQALFRNTREMERAFRLLADRAKLGDAERVELFAAVKRWVVCDHRLDPAMDPSDPDAKRLVVH